MTPSPSQPSPYSAELQTFILTKYDPLLAIVRELNEKVQTSENERLRLENRVHRLEGVVKMLQESEGTPVETAEDIEAAAPRIEQEQQLAPPWLFSCQAGTPTASIQALLEFSPENTEELDCRQWNSEVKGLNFFS